MKFSKKYKEKILNRSDKYNFYKNEYENLIKNQKNLNNEISELKKIIKDNEIKNHESNFDFNSFLISSYYAPFINAPFTDNQMYCFKFMELIGDYLCSKVDKLINKPLISVIMPVFNRKEVVMNAINSVLSQSYENFELIIVDDASTDGTTELLKKISHEKVNILYNAENKDASGARNIALNEVNGDYIAYLDSDNLFDKDYLKASVGAFIEFPDAGAIYSAQKRYNFYDSKLSQVLFGHLNKSLLFNQNYIDINCFVHKKEVLEKVSGFDEDLAIGEDWDLILKINKYYKIYSIPFLLSKYYLKVADNRKLETTPANREKVYENNHQNFSDEQNKLNKDVDIIIPIYDNDINLEECINSILSLNLENIKIIISNNNLNISIEKFKKNATIITEKNNLGFSDALINGIQASNPNSDILILNQNSILTAGSIELMKKYAYDLPNCGLIVSNQLIKDSPLIKKYAPHAHDDYWLDIAPYDNIFQMPIFFNGEILELMHSPFSCSYLRRDIYEKINFNAFNFKQGDEFMFFISEYLRMILNLKIYHVSGINVYNPSDF